MYSLAVATTGTARSEPMRPPTLNPTMSDTMITTGDNLHGPAHDLRGDDVRLRLHHHDVDPGNDEREHPVRHVFEAGRPGDQGGDHPGNAAMIGPNVGIMLKIIMMTPIRNAPGSPTAASTRNTSRPVMRLLMSCP